MTREEAINVLNDYDINFEGRTAEEIAEAHEMAIKALEAQPCNDYISRQFMYDMGATCIAARNKDGDLVALGALDILPSVAPQPKEEPESFEDCIRRSVIVHPKTGHWLSQSEYCKMNNLLPSGLGCYFWCSECNCGIDYKYFHLADYNYCPKCGIKMQEVKK